ncbi:hypothetical protein ACN28S_50135 [Cystobacter fuscus]
MGLALIYGQAMAFTLCQEGFRSLLANDEALAFALGSLWLMLTCAGSSSRPPPRGCP